MRRTPPQPEAQASRQPRSRRRVAPFQLVVPFVELWCAVSFFQHNLGLNGLLNYVKVSPNLFSVSSHEGVTVFIFRLSINSRKVGYDTGSQQQTIP